jgi:hypothetical protein
LRITQNGEIAEQILQKYIEKGYVEPEIICGCLQITQNGEIAKQILQKYVKVKNIDTQIICKCLSVLRNEKTGQKYALYILKNNDWKTKKIDLTYSSLACFGSDPNPPKVVIDIVKEIILDYFKKTPKGYFYKYANIMQIPFHIIDSWANCNDYICDGKTQNPLLETNVLKANQKYPYKIKDLSQTILKNWKSEIVKEITMPYGKIHKGDHIRLALGHPDLNVLANDVAREMQQNPDIIPDYMKEIINAIIEKNEYPQWGQDED